MNNLVILDATASQTQILHDFYETYPDLEELQTLQVWRSKDNEENDLLDALSLFSDTVYKLIPDFSDLNEDGVITIVSDRYPYVDPLQNQTWEQVMMDLAKTPDMSIDIVVLKHSYHTAEQTEHDVSLCKSQTRDRKKRDPGLIDYGLYDPDRCKREAWSAMMEPIASDIEWNVRIVTLNEVANGGLARLVELLSEPKSKAVHQPASLRLDTDPTIDPWVRAIVVEVDKDDFGRPTDTVEQPTDESGEVLWGEDDTLYNEETEYWVKMIWLVSGLILVIVATALIIAHCSFKYKQKKRSRRDLKGIESEESIEKPVGYQIADSVSYKS